ncbi:caspase family protein [Humidesulfovibrio sp.]|uniref:caspase family protein n=1 Tax=Humidesulfovibrio sp. TaxID=2910988 RepID=UPI00280BF174|nr:caspase family protein [Humidesulfovibrio sp.]
MHRNFPQPLWLPILVIVTSLLLFATGSALASSRTALVIGNSAYPTAPLKNPANDAADVAAALKKLGFDVVLLKNATMQQMEEAVREFGLKLRQGGTGLFYFAGHGVQVAGENYLVPVNAVIQSEGDVKYGCLNAGLVLAKMEDAGNGPNVVILDACRNNPFARSFRSAEAGLARMDAPTGSIIAYATAPGKVASDGDGRNGLYTQHLLRNIATPGLSVSDMFMSVREAVVRDSGKKQVPWENTSLIGRFSLAGPVAAPAPAPALQASLAPKPASAPAFQVPPPASPEESRLMSDLGAYRGTKRDEDVEAKLIARAKALAAKGSPYGLLAQGWLSEDEAVRNQAVAKAAKLGIPLALVLRAEFLADQPVSPSDVVEARELLRRAMDMGEPEARLDLGRLFILGKGGPKDVAGGERLFADLVRERPAYGTKVALAYLEFSEKVLPKPDADAKGVAYARRAASLGDIDAMMLMAELYERGGHVKKDPYEAWSWYEKAAGRGYTWAMTTLGISLRYGSEDLGVKKNQVEAFKWFRKAADLGNTSALIDVAKMTILGEGVPKDPQGGLAMLKGLADKGDQNAFYGLGTLYLDGEGVPKNRSLAYYWFAVGARNGSDVSGIRLRSLAPDIPAEERVKLDAQAAKWKPRKGM